MARSCSAALIPSGPVSITLFSIWRFRPATRTMKNSSTFDPTKDRNIRRSSSGLLLSCASSRTRLWKSSRLSSRLTNNSGSSSRRGAAGVTRKSERGGLRALVRLAFDGAAFAGVLINGREYDRYQL